MKHPHFAAYLAARSRPVWLYRGMKLQGCKICVNTIENWFRGGGLPHARHLLGIADALGVTCDEVCRVCAGEEVK